MTTLTKTDILTDRAKMFSQLREFFAARDILEVDTALLTDTPALDAHIEPITTIDGHLITSPEFAMKRLLAEGLGDIYQISHVFRHGEIGPWHNPEFTMVEYYRTYMPLATFIPEVCEIISMFLGPLPIQFITYRGLFLDHFYIDPFTAPLSELQALAKNLKPSDRDTTLAYLISHYIEPTLAREDLTIVSDYPPSQAALSRTTHSINTVALRFEIYHKGRELCNGYDELTDPEEYAARDLPYNADFAALIGKLPPSCGVAIGFDRLLALRHNLNNIHSVLP